MFNRFALNIRLGNAEMESGPDVARALREVADRIENDLEARGPIRDGNGNTVGEFGPSNEWTAPPEFVVGDTVEDNEGDVSIIESFEDDGRLRTDQGWVYRPDQVTRIARGNQ